jgi:hypothetical protein
MSHHVATVYKKSNYYELPYARIGHFILASGRLKISNIIRVNLENCVFCHTDGIILKKSIQNVQLGTDIGNLKFEESGECEVFNSCNYIFNGVGHGKQGKQKIEQENECMF